MSSGFEFTYELGCRAAQADAKHDFKGAFRPIDIQQSVSSITSSTGANQCDVKPQNEDSFLSQSILNTGSSLQKSQLELKLLLLDMPVHCQMLPLFFHQKLLITTQCTMQIDQVHQTMRTQRKIKKK